LAAEYRTIQVKYLVDLSAACRTPRDFPGSGFYPRILLMDEQSGGVAAMSREQMHVAPKRIRGSRYVRVPHPEKE
jgi:hypothetical protein